MDLDIGCSFAFDLAVATHAVLIFEPHVSEADMVVDSRLTVEGQAPLPPTSTYLDSYGNLCRRITFDPGKANLQFTARVEVSDEPDATCEDIELASPAELPDEVLNFLMPSRYCESDQLADLAWSTFGSIQSGSARVQSICDWVHERTQFRYGSSSPGFSALSVLDSGVGVCRDFTHLAIALCRSVNIPARYVFGYLPDIGVPASDAPNDFCAWMEVFLGGEWFTFDPRNNQRRIGRVVIGRGRDAADVAMVTSFGRIDLLDMAVRAEIGAGESWNQPIPPGDGVNLKG
jgi:transglutaminase-like putative cysteine protease